MFSKYPFIYQISSKTAQSINKKLQNLISQYGPPKRLYSDNGPPFSSKAFQKFLTSQYIDHITSSPLYPKSNGFIEQQIKTIKTALATASYSGKSLDDLLLSLRSTPIGRHLPSPQEILHNRTQDCPGQPPHPVDFEEVRNYLITQKSTQKKHYDKRHNVRDLPELYPGLKSSRHQHLHRRHHYRTIYNTLQLQHRSTRQNISPQQRTHPSTQHR